MKIKVQDVLKRADENFAVLCKKNGRFDTEIQSLQVKAVTVAIIEAVNKALDKLEDEIK